MTKAFCNLCGKELDELDRRENFSFDRLIGYGSRHDGEHISFDLCCDCFDEVIGELAARCKHSPIVGNFEEFFENIYARNIATAISLDDLKEDHREQT